MLNKTKIALAVALILGTASAALANDSGENNQGGAVVPGSSVGVNPADHRDNPAVRTAKPPVVDNGIRTEGRASSEELREQKEDHLLEQKEQKEERLLEQKEERRKDPEDPGPSDSKK